MADSAYERYAIPDSASFETALLGCDTVVVTKNEIGANRGYCLEPSKMSRFSES